jgi:hypothetical protein
MHILLLVDNTINRTHLGQVQLKMEGLYKRNAGIDIKWFIEYRDFSSIPKENYWGGYEGFQHIWLRNQCAEVYKRYAEEVDQVVFMQDSNHWNLNGVWGWNMSTVFSGYGVQQVRFAQNKNHSDERNINNTFGTAYHEMHHDHDGFVFIYLDRLIEPLVNVNNWDNDVTHGGADHWDYIRYNENQESIKRIAPLLRQAIAKRRALFEKRVGLMNTVIQLLQQKVVLLRQLIAQQRGDIPILEDNKCGHVKNK